jgi:hypothetical protein
LDSIDTLLKTLKDGPFFERKHAADELGRLPESTGHIISALMEAARADGDPGVRRAAIQALESPVHAEHIRSVPKVATALADVKQLNIALEAAASQEADNTTWKATRRVLNGVRLVIVGIFSLFTLTSNLPEALRWLVVGVVIIFTLAYFMRQSGQD